MASKLRKSKYLVMRGVNLIKSLIVAGWCVMSPNNRSIVAIDRVVRSGSAGDGWRYRKSLSETAIARSALKYWPMLIRKLNVLIACPRAIALK